MAVDARQQIPRSYGRRCIEISPYIFAGLRPRLDHQAGDSVFRPNLLRILGNWRQEDRELFAHSCRCNETAEQIRL
jgi:hypothetical protein